MNKYMIRLLKVNFFMQLFESRNVFDRIETTWNIFFSSAWQVRVLPQIVITALSTIIGFISLVPIFFFFSDFKNWEMLDDV